MNLPEKFEILVITLSDRAFRGEYEDKSGPEIVYLAQDHFNENSIPHTITETLIPDDAAQLREILTAASESFHIIFTTGGTGIGPRDITVDTVKPLLRLEIPGIMEFIRVKYGAVIPNALLSRSVAGIIGNSLIYTLPGSVKAVREYMNEILPMLLHTIYMQYGIDKHSKPTGV